MMMRSVPVFVFLGLLAFQVALAWPERRTTNLFPEQKREDESKLIDELLSRLLEKKRHRIRSTCPSDDDFYCWKTGCNVGVENFGEAFVELQGRNGKPIVEVGLEGCCDADGYWFSYFLDKRPDGTDLSQVQLPYSKTFTHDGETYKLHIQSIDNSGSKLSVEGLCVE